MFFFLKGKFKLLQQMKQTSNLYLHNRYTVTLLHLEIQDLVEKKSSAFSHRYLGTQNASKKKIKYTDKNMVRNVAHCSGSPKEMHHSTARVALFGILSIYILYLLFWFSGSTILEKHETSMPTVRCRKTSFETCTIQQELRNITIY